ncbi:MAG TPA: hypothetical protein PKY31_11990 [Spirochaetota bacterium]|nr:hypothetical protein [Spirochaetota bacterium]
MKTVKLIHGDVVIVGGKTAWLSGKECVAQRLANALQLDKGSWFLGPLKGIDWLSIYDEKAVPERLVRGKVESVIAADPEVTKLESMVVEFDKTEREIMVRFKAATIYGIVEGSV